MFSYTFYKFSVFFHFNYCKIYFDIELKSASSSGTNVASSSDTIPKKIFEKKKHAKKKTNLSVYMLGPSIGSELYVSIDSSEEPGQMHRLIRAFSARTQTHIGSIVVSERT